MNLQKLLQNEISDEYISVLSSLKYVRYIFSSVNTCLIVFLEEVRTSHDFFTPLIASHIFTTKRSRIL